MLRFNAPLLIGAAFVAASLLASPSFADNGGGNAKEIPLVTGTDLGAAKAQFPAPAVEDEGKCVDGFRYIERAPDEENDDPSEYAEPVPC